MPNTNNEVGKLCITDPEFEQKILLLEKHFHDRTLQPMSEFKKVGEK